MANRPHTSLSDHHPELDLRTIELELMNRVRTVKQKKRRQHPSAVEYTGSDIAGHSEIVQTTETGSCGLPQWEPVEPPPSKVPTSGKRKIDPVIRDYVVPFTNEEIEKNRLDSQEIRKIPKFRDHEFGEPSHVLYVKNLAKGVSETDLIAMFGRYEPVQQKLEYRLMTGRMRGQAFVTFTDVDSATKALKFVHGFVWKEKPILIQYGRRNR